MTRRMGLSPDARDGVRVFLADAGPWTEADAAELIKVWTLVDDDGIYRAE